MNKLLNTNNKAKGQTAIKMEEEKKKKRIGLIEQKRRKNKWQIRASKITRDVNQNLINELSRAELSSFSL